MTDFLSWSVDFTSKSFSDIQEAIYAFLTDGNTS